MVMKHPEYSRANNEYQGRSEAPRIPREARLALKQRMIDFGVHLKALEEKIKREKPVY
jgi:hypothetical protein